MENNGLRVMMDHISAKYPDCTWELVSDRSIRSIYRLLRQDTVMYYVKIYHPRNWWEKLRNFLRPRTRHEAILLHMLQASGIPVPEVLGHINLPQASALITRAVFPAKGLHDVEKSTRKTIMLEMCVNLINHGYHFTDMHAGNIILDEKNRPFLVDAYEIIPCRKITEENTAHLFAQAANVYDLTDEELDPYLSQIDAIADRDALRKRVRSLSKSLRKAQVRRMVRRSFREGSFSLIRDTASYRAQVHRNCPIDLDRTIEAHIANVSARSGLYKFQDKTQLSKVGDFCVKSYKKPSFLAAPYAKRSWKGLLTLLFNDIPVAGPAALVVFHDKKSMLITQALDQPDLDVLLSSSFGQMPGAGKRELAKALGLLMGNLHKRNIYHADLKACNIKADTDPVRFYLLDTDRVEQRGSLPWKKRLRNLVQLNTSIPVRVSRSLRMHFLKAYCSVTGGDPKDLFRKVWGLSSTREVIYRCGTGDQVEKWPEPGKDS